MGSQAKHERMDDDDDGEGRLSRELVGRWEGKLDIFRRAASQRGNNTMYLGCSVYTQYIIAGWESSRGPSWRPSVFLLLNTDAPPVSKKQTRPAYFEIGT